MVINESQVIEKDGFGASETSLDYNEPSIIVTLTKYCKHYLDS